MCVCVCVCVCVKSPVLPEYVENCPCVQLTVLCFYNGLVEQKRDEQSNEYTAPSVRLTYTHAYSVYTSTDLPQSILLVFSLQSEDTMVACLTRLNPVTFAWSKM